MEHCGLCCNEAWHLEMPCLEFFQSIIQGVAKVFRTSLALVPGGVQWWIRGQQHGLWASFWDGGQNVAG